jgi:hypothetical protein
MQLFNQRGIIFSREKGTKMKKEMLIRKLENVDMPHLLIAGHKGKLKAVLIEGTASMRQPLKVEMQADNFMGMIIRAFDWLRAPAWRAAVASGLALFIVAGVLAAVFYIVSPSPAVIAADVVKKDLAIQQRLTGSGEIIIVRVDVRDGMASVVCCRGMGDFIEADVDINVRTVVQTRRYEGLFMPELPIEEQAKAIQIASSDPRAKSLMDKGGQTGRVFPIFSSISRMSVVNGNILKVTPAASQAVVPVHLDGKTWLVQVDLVEMKTERIIEQQSNSQGLFEMYFMRQNL